MKNAKHTAGPWKITQETIDKEWNQITALGGLIVANVHIGPMPYPLGPSVPAKEANARLIAAAPELLAALQGMVARYASHESGQNDTREPAQARAAIAKATGEK